MNISTEAAWSLAKCHQRVYLFELNNMRMHQAPVIQDLSLDILCHLQEYKLLKFSFNACVEVPVAEFYWTTLLIRHRSI